MDKLMGGYDSMMGIIRCKKCREPRNKCICSKGKIFERQVKAGQEQMLPQWLKKRKTTGDKVK